MAFLFPQKVLFKHCDPAGIVFYPRYFEMINDCVEAFFDQVLDDPFEVLLRSAGIPTAEIQTRFHAPSRHGDALVLTLTGNRVGRKSFTLDIEATCGDELRFRARSTLVYTDANGQSQPWSHALKSKLDAFTGAPL
ncbi:acyl-CoA thioesterase [Pelagimonas varians]|uniref:1,4-dihydroxy-2-naphthoyl-CoA hydrolase n=1 Tax=Pelagimonas varians TaxID=696760 RepID=A0A238KGJ0_9RHOB|nr:acyl-CoA thioesterase [Pelagimonas varians]PYG32336.1 4-hydroxybenzoyl-CoA thioesterase [Pelagimonas varians]SMX41767.1 1,4-dihydroxy-2-naphthoyl-CoA hydrolase [Pelagimonas varians]